MSEPKKLKRVVIKEELVALTDDYIAALALCQFLYWSERRNDFDKFILEEKQRQPDLNADLTHGWIYKSIDELYDELMLKPLSPSTLRRRVETLVERGWIDRRRNPQFKWDKTWQYRPNIFKIQHDLLELGYSLEGYPLQFDKCILQGETSNVQGETSNVQGEIALPEITSEITTKKEELSKPEKPDPPLDPLENALEQALNSPDDTPIERIRRTIAMALEIELPLTDYQLKPYNHFTDAVVEWFNRDNGKRRKPLSHDQASEVVQAIEWCVTEATRNGSVGYPWNGSSVTAPMVNQVVTALSTRPWQGRQSMDDLPNAAEDPAYLAWLSKQKGEANVSRP